MCGIFTIGVVVFIIGLSKLYCFLLMQILCARRLRLHLVLDHAHPFRLRWTAPPHHHLFLHQSCGQVRRYQASMRSQKVRRKRSSTQLWLIFAALRSADCQRWRCLVKFQFEVVVCFVGTAQHYVPWCTNVCTKNRFCCKVHAMLLVRGKRGDNGLGLRFRIPWQDQVLGRRLKTQSKLYRELWVHVVHQLHPSIQTWGKYNGSSHLGGNQSCIQQEIVSSAVKVRVRITHHSIRSAAFTTSRFIEKSVNHMHESGTEWHTRSEPRCQWTDT